MNRENDRFVDPAEALEDLLEPVRDRVGLAVNGRDDVGARLEVERVEHVRSARSDRRELKRRVEHHVADDLAPPGDAFARQRLSRLVVGRKQDRRQAVDLDSVPLLGHLQIAAAEARLDVSLPDAGVVGRERTGERRVRVPEDEHEVRALGGDRLSDPSSHRRRLRGVEIEPVARLRQAELVEENLRQLGVVMLPRMQDDLLDPAVAKGDRERCGFDELRPVSNDRENLQGAGTLGALRAVSSVGRAGDS